MDQFHADWVEQFRGGGNRRNTSLKSENAQDPHRAVVPEFGGRAAVHVNTVQDVLGHSTVRMTQRYLHLAADPVEAVRGFKLPD